MSADNEKKISVTRFVAKKMGMTRIFTGDGLHTPVTVLQILPMRVSQIKTRANEGYNAHQFCYGEKKKNLMSKPILGQLTKAGIQEFFSKFIEVKLEESLTEGSFLGQKVSLDLFESSGCFVDVTGVSKGKGFQGVMKRYNFAGGPAAHGSHFHRRTGSVGNRATPARVFPEKKMPGHMGVDRVTVKNLQIVELNADKGYILVKGAIPGGKNSFVEVQKSRS